MLQDFFKLNSPFVRFNREELLEHLRTSKHIHGVLYEPDSLEDHTFHEITFENVSFSKTKLHRITFNACVFKDCLFIATHFDSVEFHDCSFQDSNFYKSEFTRVYAKPSQFRRAISDDRYANIAVHLYQQLSENYHQESQRQFKNEAEYYLAHWTRKNDIIQSKRKGVKWHRWVPAYVASWIYGSLFGYGYRLRNLLVTTLCIIAFAVIVNHMCARYLFSAPTQPSIVKTFYFTITTMSTLGASGYEPNTKVGYMFVVVNVMLGMTILSTTITAFFKRVIR